VSGSSTSAQEQAQLNSTLLQNRISEPFVEAANYTSIDAPKGVSEWPLSGLTPVDSKTIKPPRVGESGFSMECVLGAFALPTFYR
jgi:flavin reductase (DIM6/NTAB) family NADH-FMN oxidoreductase RutF